MNLRTALTKSIKQAGTLLTIDDMTEAAQFLPSDSMQSPQALTSVRCRPNARQSIDRKDYQRISNIEFLSSKQYETNRSLQY